MGDTFCLQLMASLYTKKVEMVIFDIVKYVGDVGSKLLSKNIFCFNGAKAYSSRQKEHWNALL